MHCSDALLSLVRWQFSDVQDIHLSYALVKTQLLYMEVLILLSHQCCYYSRVRYDDSVDSILHEMNQSISQVSTFEGSLKIQDHTIKCHLKLFTLEILSPGSLNGSLFQGWYSAIYPWRFVISLAQEAQEVPPRGFFVNIASSSRPFDLWDSWFISISNNALI